MKKIKELLSDGGKLVIVALDHRGSLKRLLNKDNPELVSEVEMMAWKKKMIELYRGEVSGILIDPVYGQELVDTKTKCGWLMSMEKSGYRGGQKKRVTELLENWSVQQLHELGVSGAKLLLYYEPENRELAELQLQLAERVSRECQREGVVFLLEPLNYIEDEVDKGEKIVETVRQVVSRVKVDVLKVEYPGSREKCEEISRLVNIPWVLLSAGMKFDDYKKALKVACESGASGMAVGRAIWQEFGEYQGEERERFLEETSVQRLKELVEIVEKYAKKVE